MGVVDVSVVDTMLVLLEVLEVKVEVKVGVGVSVLVVLVVVSTVEWDVEGIKKVVVPVGTGQLFKSGLQMTMVLQMMGSWTVKVLVVQGGQTMAEVGSTLALAGRT